MYVNFRCFKKFTASVFMKIFGCSPPQFLRHMATVKYISRPFILSEIFFFLYYIPVSYKNEKNIFACIGVFVLHFFVSPVLRDPKLITSIRPLVGRSQLSCAVSLLLFLSSSIFFIYLMPCAFSPFFVVFSFRPLPACFSSAASWKCFFFIIINLHNCSTNRKRSK